MNSFPRLPKRFANASTATTFDFRARPPKGVKYHFAKIERSGYTVIIDKLPPPAERPPPQR